MLIPSHPPLPSVSVISLSTDMKTLDPYAPKELLSSNRALATLRIAVGAALRQSRHGNNVSRLAMPVRVPVCDGQTPATRQSCLLTNVGILTCSDNK